MEILRQFWRDAQTVLRDMSTTQRVAVTFLILTVAALLTFAAWMGSTSSEPGRRALPLEVEPGDVNDVLARLREKGITSAEYDFESKRVLVLTAEEKAGVIALAEDGLLRDSHRFGFETMLDRWSFSDTRLKSEETMRLARANEVSKLIESLEAVSDAQVIYSDDAKASLFGVAHKKSASVRVKTRLRKPLTEETANTIIALVAAAKAGLDERDIVVSDQMGNKFHSSSTSSMSSVARQKWDQEYALNEQLRRKLENLMREYIPNIHYEGDVNAFPKYDIDFDYKEITERIFLPGEVATSTSRTITEQSVSRPSEEPGVNPNVRRAANMPDESGQYYTESSRSEKENQRTNDNSVRETLTKPTPRVANLTISAIIHLPYRLRKDENGKLIPATNEYGEELIDPETRKTMWERESVDPLPVERVEELKRQIAQAAGVALEDIPEKIELSQIPWIPPVHAPIGGEPMWVQGRNWIVANAVFICLLAFLLFSLIFILRFLVLRPIPTEVDEAVDHGALSLDMKSELDEEERQDDEWEDLRAKVAAAVQEDPKRAAGLLKRWMRKE